MLQKFEPCSDHVDRRILYEITGKPISNDKYWDTSDEDTPEEDISDSSNEDMEEEENPNTALMKRKAVMQHRRHTVFVSEI